MDVKIAHSELECDEIKEENLSFLTKELGLVSHKNMITVPVRYLYSDNKMNPLRFKFGLVTIPNLKTAITIAIYQNNCKYLKIYDENLLTMMRSIDKKVLIEKSTILESCSKLFGKPILVEEDRIKLSVKANRFNKAAQDYCFLKFTDETVIKRFEEGEEERGGEEEREETLEVHLKSNDTIIGTINEKKFETITVNDLNDGRCMIGLTVEMVDIKVSIYTTSSFFVVSYNIIELNILPLQPLGRMFKQYGFIDP